MEGALRRHGRRYIGEMERETERTRERGETVRERDRENKREGGESERETERTRERGETVRDRHRFTQRG